MGTNYSAGPLPRPLQPVLDGMTLLRVRALMVKFARRRQSNQDVVRRDDMFLSREEIKWLFKLRIMQVYEMFRMYDHEMVGRIGVYDLWGSLALISTDVPDDKVEFIFGLADYSKSGYLTRTNLSNLMLCATRGLSRLKGIRAPELKILNKTLSVIAGMAMVNENGGIGLRDVRVTMLTDENCKAYFAALGTQVLASVDSGKLVAQRREILLEIAAVEAQIDEVALRLNITKESQEVYAKERGGDISALQMHELDAKPKRKNATDTNYPTEDEPSSTSMDAMIGLPSDEQRLRRLHRARELNAVKGKALINDAVVFMDAKARNLKSADDSAGGGGDFDYNAVYRKWSTLKCADDGMCELDVDIVEDLFEAAGIILTDAEAEDCLSAVPPNQLGRRRVEDVIEWYRRKLCTDVPVSVLPLWRNVANQAHQTLTTLQQTIFQAATDLKTQRGLVDAIAAKEKLVAAASIQNATSLADVEEDRGSSSAMTSVVGEIQGSQRLVAWQRQQIQSPATLLNWEFSFGHPEKVPMPPVSESLDGAAAASATQDSPKKASSKISLAVAKAAEKQKEAAKAAAEATWEREKWKMNASFDLTVTPPPTTVSDRAPFFHPETLIIKDDLVALDLLDYFKKNIPATATSIEVNVPFGTVAWTIFNIAPSATAEEEMLLIKLLVNFFDSVPTDYRANFYNKVEAKSLFIQTSPPSEAGSAEKSRVVLLVLLHEEDWFRNIEEKLPAGLILSRAVRRLSLSFRSLDSLDELYKSSFPFETFDERLFGPQEDELGDEGMNPIRFAKLQRQRQAAVQESITRAFRMSDQELQMLLKDRGLNIFGNHTELATRARAAFKRQAEISGFGELSAWGADISKRVFRKFIESSKASEDHETEKTDTAKKKGTKPGTQQPASETRGLSLWELNNLLASTGAETIYDKRDYKKVMEEQQFYVDKESQLLESGIVAYYELYGQLAKDIRTLGIGSLNEKLKGEVRVFMAYEPVAFASLLDLLESHTLLQKPLKIFAGLLSSLSEVSLESEFETIHELFNIGQFTELENLRAFVNSPGWISSAVHKASEWLANGEDGVLRSLRKSVLTTFGKYHYWDEPFDEFLRTLNPAEAEPHDDEPFSLQAFLFSRLEDILPPVIKNEDKADISKVIDLRKQNIELGDIIVNSEGKFRISREQREALMHLRARNEADAVDVIRKLEEEKQLCAAHALALYDGLRKCVTGTHSVGFGGKDMNLRLALTGCDWVRYLPKGIGEKSIPRQIAEDKLRRAAQRKEAAFAALERERMRKDKNNPDRVDALKKKAERKQQLKLEEEAKAFDDAYKALSLAREERKSAAEIATMVRLWEKLQTLKNSRYPKSLAAAVSLNNFSCVLQEFYGPDHFRGKDALKCQDAALGLFLGSVLPLEVKGGFDDDEEEATCRSLDSDSILHIHREGTAEISQEQWIEFARSGTRVFSFTEDQLVPYLAVLQNSLTLLRLSSADARNLAQLDKLLHVKRLVKLLYEALGVKDRDRVKKKLSKPLEGTLVMFMGDVEAQLKITLAEVTALEQEVSEEDKVVESFTKPSKSGPPGKGSPTLAGLESSSKVKKMTSLATAGDNGAQSQEEFKAEIALRRAEAEEKERKMLDARKAANQQRAQTIRRRNRLYQLVSTGEINRIFEMKAGHVLAEGSKINWGTDAASVGDPLDFLDSEAGSSLVTDDQSTSLATFQTGSIASAEPSALGNDDDGPWQKEMSQKKKKSKSKSRSVQFDEESLGGGESVATFNSFDAGSVLPPSPGEDGGESPPAQKRGKAGLLSWLFRNRDKL